LLSFDDKHSIIFISTERKIFKNKSTAAKCVHTFIEYNKKINGENFEETKILFGEKTNSKNFED
jgi:hypothetical protein